MNIYSGAAQLYTFLFYCNKSELDRTILDCGAGGKNPPLALFAEQGYKTFGIDIDDSQLDKARQFEASNNLRLNISKGDMRELPFDDNSISFVYSYNSVFHMLKADIKKSIAEMERILKPGGYCFVNLLSNDDMSYGEGEMKAPGEFHQEEYGKKVIHSYFDKNEAEEYFGNLKVVYKETRIRELDIQNVGKVKWGFIDYILEKDK